MLKTASMEVGQVSYHDKTKVKRMRVEKDNAIVNDLNRTKEVIIISLSLFEEEKMEAVNHCCVSEGSFSRIISALLFDHRKDIPISQHFKRNEQQNSGWRIKLKKEIKC